MLAEFDYLAPESVGAAVAALSATADGRPLAGGHGLLTSMKRRRQSPSLLVDLRRIGDLHGVSETAGDLCIGALTTLTQLLDRPGLALRHPALVEAVRATGDPQLRNRGTVGGSLATRHACADVSAPLLLADAAVTVVGPDGERTLPLVDLYRTGGPPLGLSELVTAIHLPALPVGLGSAYEKVTDRTTLEPVCGVAAGARLAADGTLDSVRLALTGATFRPVRLTDAERALTGTRLPVDAGPLPIGELAGFVDDAIASATYRAHLTRVLVRRALNRAATRRVPDPGTPG
jgi:carbon-monoxide dehydrogenase medium subunit